MSEEDAVEYRSMTTELRVDLSKRRIFGLANVFGNKDAFGTVFDKGAFKKTIRNKFSVGKGKIKFLFNHDPWSMIGTLTRLREGEEGLEFEGRVSETPLGNEILTLVQDKALTDNSIGFRRVRTEMRVEDDDDDEEPTLHFTEVELFDVSPVTFGANDLAVIGGTRRMPDIQSLADEIVQRFLIQVPDLSELLKRLEGGTNGRQEEVNSQSNSSVDNSNKDNEDRERDGKARLRLSRARLTIAEAEGR
jgi:HK97 family phage prohead protease